MAGFLVLEPAGDLSERTGRIRQGACASIVAFEGFDKVLRDAVGLGALDRGEAGALAKLRASRAV